MYNTQAHFQFPWKRFSDGFHFRFDTTSHTITDANLEYQYDNHFAHLLSQ